MNNYFPLDTPESVLAILKSLQLDDQAKFRLNRDLANLTRRHFRAQIKAQKNAHNSTPYAPRSKRTRRSGGMFTGLSRSLKTYVSTDFFEVGLTGVPGIVARQHQEGANVGYGYRINGWFNATTNRWEGGTKTRGAYKLPPRVMIGWSEQLKNDIQAIILKNLEVS